MAGRRSRGQDGGARRGEQYPAIVLPGSGYRAVIEPDRWVPGSFTLVVNGTPQSHVNMANPGEVFFEYIQRMTSVIDLIGRRGEPITGLHLGAGAFTLPRYIEHTRPGSRQQVIELERELVDFVREHLPLPRGANIRVRYGDARAGLANLPEGLRGTVDLLVVDVFSGSRIPPHVTTIEFYREAVEFLARDGLVLVNIADGPNLPFARGQVSTLREAVGSVTVIAESGVMKSRRYGNLVLVGSRKPLPLEWVPRITSGGPHPTSVLFGSDVVKWMAGASVVTDETASPSPGPSPSLFTGL